MTLATILADVYRRCGYASSPAADVTTRLTAFVNEAQQEVMSEPGMEWLLTDQTTLASVAAQAEYSLPNTIEGIKSIRDTSNRRRLTPMSLGTYRWKFPNPVTDPGVPEYYVSMGQTYMLAQPSAAGQLNVISSAAGDTGTAYIEGFLSTGVPFASSVAMTGVTLASIGGATSLTITKFYISAAAVGLVQLRASTTVLSQIPIGYTTPRYRAIALVPTPVSILTYTIDYERTVTDMSIATDEPVIPAKFHRLLADGARAREYEKQNQLDRMQVARAEFVMGLKRLKYWVYAQAVGNPNLRSTAGNRAQSSAVNVTTS